MRKASRKVQYSPERLATLAMTPKTTASYGFGPFQLDPDEHLLLCDGRPVPLTPKVFDVLRVLVEHHGRLVDKATFFEQVWPDSFVEEANLNRSIAVLRKALGESAAGAKYIETVPKRGYRFVAPVTRSAGPAVRVRADDTNQVASTPCRDPRGSDRDSDEADEYEIRVSDRTAVPSSHDHAVRSTSRRRGSRRVAAAMVVAGCAGLFAWVFGRAALGDPTAMAVPQYRQVTFAGREGVPAISADGHWIAYVSAGRSDRSLVVQELAGGPPLTVFQAPEVLNVRWSPDGSELLFAARGGGTDGVFAVARSGGAARRVAARPLVATWSPDGAMIVLARYQSGTLEFITRLGEPLRTISLRDLRRWIADIDWSSRDDRLLVVGNDNAGRSTVLLRLSLFGEGLLMHG